MAGIQDILDSVRRIISRWTITNTPLVVSASAGDTEITVNTTSRFRDGDEATILTPTHGETDIFIEHVVDERTLRLESPLTYNFPLSESPILHKTTNGLFMQAIYLGEPDVIPMYPACTVNAVSRQSEWMTLDSTKEIYNVQINIYVQDSNQEDAYRFLLTMTEIIQAGLKKNIYPMVGPYEAIAVTADISAGDTFIRIADTSGMIEDNYAINQRLLLEDPWQTQEFVVSDIVDQHTVQITPPACKDYLVSDGAIVIAVNRFIWNSWPNNINYGTIFKESMLKAATIDWFAWEEEYRGPDTPLDQMIS